MIPEVDEHFTVNLTSVVPTDGSTPTSAASLRPGFTEVNITIQQSDYPNGLLQFMSSVPVTNETISPSTSQFNLDVRESAGVLTLHVVRAQGTLGTLTRSSLIFQARQDVYYLNNYTLQDYTLSNLVKIVDKKILNGLSQ